MFRFRQIRTPRVRRWWSRRRVCAASYIVLFVFVVYAVSMIWSFHQIATTGEHSGFLPVRVGDGQSAGALHSNEQKEVPSVSLTTVAHEQLNVAPPATTATTIRVLILIASVPRTPETICTTLQAIFDNYFGSSGSTSDLKNRTTSTVLIIVEPPVVLVHRYGPWTCNYDDNGTTPGAAGDHRRGISVIVRDYPPHERVSNAQQTHDYLELMNDGLQLLQQQQQKESVLFSHVLFLDDDVELCPQFSEVVSLIHTVVSSHDYDLTLAHLGRGGSGVLVSSSNLVHLRDSVLDDRRGRRQHSMKDLAKGGRPQRNKNIDKSFLEWALQVQRGCTIRPTTIQMRHIGLESRLHPGETWEDVDQCGQASNNRAWQSLSESSLHPALFSEYCVYSANCSPYSSRGVATLQGSNRSDDSVCQCLPGFTGSDCGIPNDATSSTQYIRRKLNAPIVVMLSAKSAVEEGMQHRVLADAGAHHLVNLYLIGYSARSQWLADNVYVSTSDAHHMLDVELNNSSRFGEMAFPIELIILDKLLPPQELWTLKYYEEAYDK
jgi:hypothetical protein